MGRLRLFLSSMFLGAAILAATATGEEPQPAHETILPGLDFSIFGDAPENEKVGKLTPDPDLFKEISFIHELSDPKRLAFEGAHMFSEEQLRLALAHDLKFQAAARPSNKTVEFLDVLQKRLREGYLRSGCPDVTVVAMCDGRREAVVVRIDEGPRFRMGEIRVTGQKRLDAAALAARLTEKLQPRAWRFRRSDAPVREKSDDVHNDADDEQVACWEPGEPVDFRSNPQAKFAKGVRLTLDDLGYAAASFHVELVREPEKELLHAHIAILNESSTTTIGRIEVMGLNRDSEEALFEYLKIAPGDALDADVLQQIDDRLADSCRYWMHAIEVVIEPGGDKSGPPSASAVLRIGVDEFAAAPPLGEPLPATDEVLRKTAAWIKSLMTDPESPDLLCTLAGANFGGALHATQVGLAADGTMAIEARLESVRGLALDHTVIAGAGCAEIYDWKFEEKFCCAPDSRPIMQMVITAGYDSDRKQVASLSLGYAFGGSERGEGSARYPGRVRIAPVAVVRLAHLPGSNVELNDGVLRLQQDHFELEIDEATGQVRSLQAAAFPLVGVSTVHLETRSGAVEEMVERARNRAADFPNRYDASNLIASALSFGLEQFERQPEIRKYSSRSSFFRAARQLIESRELREALAKMRSSTRENDEDRDLAKFQISDEPSDDNSDWLDLVLPHGPAAADALFPHGSMPWTVTREYCFWHLSRGKADPNFDEFNRHATNEILRVLRDGDMGPVSYMLLAHVYRSVFSVSRKYDAEVATMGLADLQDTAIAKDVKLLTEGDHGLAVACRAATELLGKMSEEDRRQLLELVPEDFRSVIRQLIIRRGEKPDEPPADSLAHVLMETWRYGLRDAVEAELRSLSVQIAERPEADEPVAK
jgi:hypothetical protein